MRNLLRYLGLRGLAEKPGRSLLTLLGIACGVAAWVVIALVNRATLETVRRGFDALAGRAALAVVGPATGFPEEVQERVKGVPGVARAVPLVDARGYFTAADGRPRGLMVLGVDLLEEAAIRRYHIRGGDDPLELLNDPDAILLAEDFAAEHGLARGATLRLATAQRLHDFNVRGLLAPEGAAGAYGGQVALMDVDAARVTFGREGRTDRLDLLLAPGAVPDDVAARVQAVLGPSLRVERPQARAEALERMVASFQALLSLVSLVALLVGVFLVAGTMGIAVAERRRELGTLRAVGATRASLLALVLSEAAVLGLLGGAAGVGLGRLLAGALVRSVSTTIGGQVMVPLVVRQVALAPWEAAAGVVLGALAALLGALGPALRTLSVNPLEALRPPPPPVESASARALPGLLGLGLLALLVLSSKLGLGDRHPALRALDAALAIGGALLATGPLVAGPVALLRRALSRGGGERLVSLRLACENLSRRARRTGHDVRSLTLGLLLVTVIATLAASFKDSVTGWFGNILRWDLLVTGTGSLVSGQLQPVHEDLGRELNALDGVIPRASGRACALRFTSVIWEGTTLAVKAYDRPEADDEWGVFDLRGRPLVAEGHRLFDSPTPAALVSEPFSLRTGKRAGDVLELDTPAGRTRFAIVGIVTDYASPEGVVYLDRTVYKRLWGDPLVSGFGLRVKPGHDPAAVRREIEARFGPSRGLFVATNADVRKETEQTLDDAFSFTWALTAAALLVGLFGLLNTLLVSVLERTRELGALRAVGMSRAQLAGMVLAEALVQGTLGAVVAALLGALLSWAWVVGTVSNVIGWLVSFVFPWVTVLPALAAGLGVGLAAGLLPAWRAARLPITEALAHE